MEGFGGHGNWSDEEAPATPTPDKPALDDEVERASRDRQIFANACAKADAFAESLTRTDPPTTNGGVERRVLRIEWDDARPVAAVYEQDGIEVMRCSIATNLTPRAASDDEVERIIEDLSDLKIAAPVLGFMGLGRRPRLVHEIHELANEAAAVLAALTHHSDLTKRQK